MTLLFLLAPPLSLAVGSRISLRPSRSFWRGSGAQVRTEWLSCTKLSHTFSSVQSVGKGGCHYTCGEGTAGSLLSADGLLSSNHKKGLGQSMAVNLNLVTVLCQVGREFCLRAEQGSNVWETYVLKRSEMSHEDMVTVLPGAAGASAPSTLALTRLTPASLVFLFHFAWRLPQCCLWIPTESAWGSP